MKVRVLGCSGGLGEIGARTTSLLVDDDILIDAGTGLADLSLDELVAIDHVFLTHSHMDHIACLPMLVDAVWQLRDQPIKIYGLAETLEALRRYIFNWVIWPDFSALSNSSEPAISYVEIHVGAAKTLNGRTLTPTPASHTVPAVGYLLDSGRKRLGYTGDTAPCSALWTALNRVGGLNYLIAETAFPDRDHALADAAKHLSPCVLADELSSLTCTPEIFFSHLKPGKAADTMHDMVRVGVPARPLLPNQLFEL